MNRMGNVAVLVGLFALTLAAIATARGIPISCTGGVCTGTPDNDEMFGSTLEDDMRGLGGDDRIYGEGDDDILRGGAGEDYLSEDKAPSEDTQLGGGGDDERLQGGLMGDVLRGGAGDERLQEKLVRRAIPLFRLIVMFGDEGPDKLFGGGGNDSMEGEEGRDLMTGGSGSDYLDAINDDTAGTKDRIKCGKGFDRYSARAGDVVADDCEKKVPPTPDVPPTATVPF